MMKTKPVSAQKMPHNAVVQDYLDSMLRAATEDRSNNPDHDESVHDAPMESPVLESVIPASSVVAIPDIVEAETVAVTKANLLFEVDSGFATTPGVEQPVTAQTELLETGEAELDLSNQTLEIEQDLLPELTRAENGLPDWAQSEFECLLFTVDHFTLAAPLVELGGIVPMDKNLTPIFAQPDWFLGVLRWNDRNIRVVDTAKLIAPEEAGESALSPIASMFRESSSPQEDTDTLAEQSDEVESGEEIPASEEVASKITHNTEHSYRFVILIQGTDWGLAVNSAREAIRLHPGAVKWRVKVKNQPWFAGTVVDKMCALIDVNAVGHDLYQRQKEE